MSVFPRFHPRLQQAIAHRLGWTRLRPVQDLAGEALLAGHNAVVLAPTAGGKTEASIFPTLSQLLEQPPLGLAALYIAPIKALLNNQARRLELYTDMVGLRRTVWHGDVGSADRQRFLRHPSALLMTTPESLEVMLDSGRVDAPALFADVRTVIIDEIHALAGQDRGGHLMAVLERIAALSRHDVQRVGLSATVGNPDAILQWLQGSSQRPGSVIDPPAPPAARQLLVTYRGSLEAIGADAARLAAVGKSLVFCQSRATTEAIAGHMRRRTLDVFVHHSAVSRQEREDAEARFHEGDQACIVCTSTLELGIDVGDLDRVLQVEAPSTVSSFLQRMGRTGRRAGQKANTTFLAESPDGVLLACALIELARKGWVEAVQLSDRAWPVLVHQVLAKALGGDGRTALGGVHRAEIHTLARAVPDLRGFTTEEIDALFDHMIAKGFLTSAAGALVLGPAAEKRFGRRNYTELYAVFSSPQSYAVQTADGSPVGSLDQAFVDRLVEQVSTFLLSGRPWAVDHINHSDRIVTVFPAPRGSEPTWGGYIPQFLGFELCRQVRRVLQSDDDAPYLHDGAKTCLLDMRERFARVVAPGGSALEQDDGEVRWWTFAGGRINGTLKHALLAAGGDWKVITDNFAVKVRAEGIDKATVATAINRLRQPDIWEDGTWWASVHDDLPAYRLSKFQDAMPDHAVQEMLGAYLLDVAGARGFVREGR